VTPIERRNGEDGTIQSQRAHL